MWFVVFGKFEASARVEFFHDNAHFLNTVYSPQNAQFEHTKERSSVTPVSRGSGGSPTTSASDHVNRYNGLTPFYAV